MQPAIIEIGKKENDKPVISNSLDLVLSKLYSLLSNNEMQWIFKKYNGIDQIKPTITKINNNKANQGVDNSCDAQDGNKKSIIFKAAKLLHSKWNIILSIPKK